MPNSLTADIAIIGSGFAGSLTALILKKLGFTTVLLDKSTHPRFSIGESSTPLGNLVLRDLAARYNLPWLKPLTSYGLWQEYYPHLRVGRKRGFTYFKHEPHERFELHSNHSNELLVAASKSNEQADMHWYREDVDAFLFKEAKRAGVLCYENTMVERMDHQTPWTLLCRQERTTFEVKAFFIVDATGRAGALSHFLKIPSRVDSFQTNTHAYFAHMDGLPSWHTFLSQNGTPPFDHPFYCDDAALHHLLQNAWVWMLRFNTGRTSAGLVLDSSQHPPKVDFEEMMAQYPSLLSLFESATFAAPTHKLVPTGRLQHRWAQTAGPTWAMLPHTAGFVDPLHSTGIAHALFGVERLVNILETHWGSPSLASAMETYDQILNKELDHIDLLIHGCYKAMNHFELFSTYTMLYFAAAIACEEDRIAHATAGTQSNRYFLCAEDSRLKDIISSTYYHLTDICENPITPGTIAEFTAETTERIAPYNSAGLFNPRIPNMYEYTATV